MTTLPGLGPKPQPTNPKSVGKVRTGDGRDIKYVPGAIITLLHNSQTGRYHPVIFGIDRPTIPTYDPPEHRVELSHDAGFDDHGEAAGHAQWVATSCFPYAELRTSQDQATSWDPTVSPRNLEHTFEGLY